MSNEAQIRCGAVVARTRPDCLVSEAIGSERQGDSSRPMQRHSVFRIAALTRPVVSVAALTLMEEGRLALSDPVERFIPDVQSLQVGAELD
jgi:CubicO group peptidase (beta-lactamase class C family)